MDRKQISEAIERWLQSNKKEAISLVQSLVRIPSVNHPPQGNELAYQQFFAETMISMGAEVELYELSSVPSLTDHPAYMSGRNYEHRPNVIGCFKGSQADSHIKDGSDLNDGHGADGRRSLLFSGHADTVYEGVEQWTHPPFDGTVVDGKLYGRGAYDMKGGMAASLMAIQCLQDLGVPLAGDVWVESVVDEEHGGANGTLAGRLRGPAQSMAIIPEPSNLELYTAHLGGGIWKATFEGKSGIGFAGEVLISALDATIAFANVLQQFIEEYRRQNPPPLPWTADQEAGLMITRLISGDVHRELMEKLPATGEIQFWIEGFPGMTGDRIISELLSFMDTKLEQYPILQHCRPVITPLIRYLEASETAPSKDSEELLYIVGQTGERIRNQSIKKKGAPFACDGFLFNLHSETPAVILGPAGGNAHAADEFLDVDSYCTLIRWYAEMIIDWCGISEDGK